jgi:hypothetical protein
VKRSTTRSRLPTVTGAVTQSWRRRSRPVRRTASTSSSQSRLARTSPTEVWTRGPPSVPPTRTTPRGWVPSSAGRSGTPPWDHRTSKAWLGWAGTYKYSDYHHIYDYVSILNSGYVGAPGGYGIKALAFSNGALHFDTPEYGTDNTDTFIQRQGQRHLCIWRWHQHVAQHQQRGSGQPTVGLRRDRRGHGCHRQRWTG